MFNLEKTKFQPRLYPSSQHTSTTYEHTPGTWLCYDVVAIIQEYECGPLLLLDVRLTNWIWWLSIIGTKENYVHVTLAWKFHESCPNSPMDLIYFDLLFFFFSAQMKCEYQKSIIIGSKKLISKINTKLYKHAFAIYLPQQSVLCFISNCLSFYLFDVHV